MTSAKRSPRTASSLPGAWAPSTTWRRPCAQASPGCEQAPSYPRATTSAASSSTRRLESCARWSRTRLRALTRATVLPRGSIPPPEQDTPKQPTPSPLRKSSRADARTRTPARPPGARALRGRAPSWPPPARGGLDCLGGGLELAAGVALVGPRRSQPLSPGGVLAALGVGVPLGLLGLVPLRSEEHTSELQSR